MPWAFVKSAAAEPPPNVKLALCARGECDQHRVAAISVRGVHPPALPLDPQRVFAADLDWATDEFPWFRAEHEGQLIFLRLNTTFPDDAAYSLLIDRDVTVEFDDFPPCWTRGPLDWPDAKAL